MQHQIGLFSTNGQGENRLTQTFLAMLEQGLFEPFVKKFIDKDYEASWEFGDLKYRTEFGAGEGSKPDGRIEGDGGNFLIYLENKVRDDLDEPQLRRHRDALQKKSKAIKILLSLSSGYTNPLMEKEGANEEADVRLRHASWRSINKWLTQEKESIVKDKPILKLLVEHFIRHLNDRNYKEMDMEEFNRINDIINPYYDAYWDVKDMLKHLKEVEERWEDYFMKWLKKEYGDSSVIEVATHNPHSSGELRGNRTMLMPELISGNAGISAKVFVHAKYYPNCVGLHGWSEEGVQRLKDRYINDPSKYKEGWGMHKVGWMEVYAREVEKEELEALIRFDGKENYFAETKALSRLMDDYMWALNELHEIANSLTGSE